MGAGSLNTTTGVITGIPTNSGSGNLVIGAANTEGTPTYTISWVVVDVPVPQFKVGPLYIHDAITHTDVLQANVAFTAKTFNNSGNGFIGESSVATDSTGVLVITEGVGSSGIDGYVGIVKTGTTNTWLYDSVTSITE
jgi:hypothetical protein